MTRETKPKRQAPAFDPMDLPSRRGTSYPPAFQAECEGRVKRVLGDGVGLTRIGVNLVRLEPGAWSGQRHWHSHEDEFVYVLEGEITLATDAGEQVLTPGMAAGFPAGVADGHCLINRGEADAVYFEVGDRMHGDRVLYPDIDMIAEPLEEGDGTGRRFTNRKGEPF